MLEVVVALDPAARCTGKLRRQHRDVSRSLDHGHALMDRLPGVVRSFVVVACGRAVALRDPIDHDGGQQIALAEARLDVAVTIAATEFLDYPGKQSHWRTIERHRDRQSHRAAVHYMLDGESHSGGLVRGWQPRDASQI